MSAGDPPKTNAVIAASASLSDSVDLGGGKLALILLPNNWTAANITFQVSPDNSTWYDLYDDAGTEYTITATSGAGRALAVTIAELFGLRYVKIRSGTGASPVTQSTAATIGLIQFT